MNFYNYLHQYLIQPLSDYSTGWQINQSLKFLNKSQWWSKDELYEYQCIRLKGIIDHAYKNTVYYRELFDKNGIDPNSIKTPEDLKIIPITTKEAFRKNFPDNILAKNVPEKSYFRAATSGSTGRQLIAYISKVAYGMKNASGVRGLQWAGYRLGDKYIKITQNKRKNFKKKMQDFVNRGYLHTHKYDEQGFLEFIKLINRVKPKIVRSYPDPLIFISNYVKQRNIVLPEIMAISTTGNTLFNETREHIEKSFNTKVFDDFSCEGSARADECETHNCYHMADEYAVTEILDEDGKEVEPGKRGLLVTTDLWNYACPFIRYDSRDFIVKAKDKCTCGRELTPIKKIEGRDNDILVTPDGRFMIAQNFTTFFKYIDCIEQFQVVQKELNNLTFKLVTTNKYDTTIENRIISHWEEYTNKSMKVNVEKVEEIPLRISGKRQFLVRNSSIKLW